MLVKLDKTGYDKYLDYLKGVAIIMVLFNHGALNLANEALYPLWIFEAVPLFLLIQVFHVYKKDTARYPSLTKLWDRILKPFSILKSYLLLTEFLPFSKEMQAFMIIL